MTRPAEGPGTPQREMVTLDRIRLTGLLQESPANAGLFHLEASRNRPRRSKRRRLLSACIPYPGERGAVICHTETCLVLSLVNGSRFQPLQRSRSVILASCAIRSSSDGHT
jgi:hypothetical protein